MAFLCKILLYRKKNLNINEFNSNFFFNLNVVQHFISKVIKSIFIFQNSNIQHNNRYFLRINKYLLQKSKINRLKFLYINYLFFIKYL
jgi:hypothetical protein